MTGAQWLVALACGATMAVSANPALAQQETAQPDNAAQPPAGAVAAPESFFVQAYDISGVTKLTAAEVERLVYPFSGPDRTQNDVELARKALQDAYSAKGFEATIVEIPIQPVETFNAGIIQIAVNEVPIGRVRVTESRFHALSIVREQVPSLREGEPVNFQALQADIASANRFPDRTINPEFKPGLVPGTLDVDLRVEDERPLHASLELNNDGSPQTTPLRLTANVRYTNLFQIGHTANLTYIVAPERRLDTEVFAGSYTIPFLSSAWTLALSGYYSNSDIATIGANVLGNGYQVGVRAIYRLPADRTIQTISFGPDFKDFKQNILVGNTTASTAPIQYIPFEAQYSLAGATENSNFSFSLGATVGVRIIKRLVCFDVAGTCVLVDQFQNREQSSNENFFRGNVSASYERVLSGDLIASARVSAQLADSHLITNEQFAAGGQSNVRGYFSAEAVGDNGVSGALEFRSPSLAGMLGPWLDEARFYVFADGALVQVLDPLPGQTADFNLASLGGGLLVQLFGHFSGNVLVGVPLVDGPTTQKGDLRVNFSVRGEF